MVRDMCRHFQPAARLSAPLVSVPRPISIEAGRPYADGVFTGYGNGFRGTTQVSVTVEGGQITDITVVSYADDSKYFSKASSGMISSILSTQGIDVSTVSGATYSSRGILEAVANALGLEYTAPAVSGTGRGGRGH